jgi:hypothetical protein
MLELINTFDTIFNHYKNNIEEYNIQEVKPISFKKDKQFIITPNNKPKINLIDNILTESVTTEFLKLNSTIIDIIELYVKIYEHAINRYIEYIYNVLHVDMNDKIKFVLKGGMPMLLIFKNIKSSMSNNIGTMFNELFIKNIFNKSDIDFQIVVNYDDIADIHHQEKVFDDLHNLSFIILSIVRDYIVKNKYQFSDFEKNKTKYQKIILEKIRTNINKSIPNDINRDNYCKIGTKKIYEEAPCPNNVEHKYDYAYDQLYIKHPTLDDIIIINTPRKIGLLNMTKQYQYILSANVITFNNIQNQLVKFGLTRMKVFFSLYKNTNKQNIGLECCKYEKGKGEIIDVSINHPTTYNKCNLDNYKRKQINDFECNIPTLDYFISEHQKMLLVQIDYPWNLKKWEKRLKRAYSLITAKILLNFSLDNYDVINNIINNCHSYINEYNYNYNYSTSKTIDVDIPELSGTQHLIDIQNNCKIFIEDIIHKINTYDKVNSERINLEIFIEISKECINNIKQIIELSHDNIKKPMIAYNSDNLTDIVTQLGGGINDMCDKNVSSNIIKKIIDYLQSFKGNNITSKTEIDERFELCYIYLIENFLKLTPLSQVYINNMNNEIYNSTTSISYKYDEKNNIRDNDYNLNITCLMFLSFLLEYHCFLISYENIEINNNSFRQLLWDQTIDKKDTYKDELLNKNPEELLNLFCNDINVRFYRFIEIILLKLNIKLNSYGHVITLDDIKQIMFENKHKEIDNYDKYTLYNYMYCLWKKKLAKFMASKVTDNDKYPRHMKKGKNYKIKYFITVINDIIKDSIHFIMKQTKTIDSNDIYSPDGTGMFSNLFLNDLRFTSNNNKAYYGNCMSSSLFEIYLLLRIYEDGNSVGVRLESENTDIHAIWKITQTELGRNVSHYASIWNTIIYDERRGKFKKENMYFRSDKDFWNNTNYMFVTNGKINTEILKLFLYNLIDYRIYFIRHNITNSTSTDKIMKLRSISNKIIEFIEYFKE